MKGTEGIIELFDDVGNAAKLSQIAMDDLARANHVYGDPNLNRKDHAKIRAKNKAAKKARRMNRGN